MLESAESIHMDGTFKCVPLIFSQLYTILARVGEEVIPAVFSLLPTKTKEQYQALFDVLVDRCPDLKPEVIHSDFEIGAIHAAQSRFPDASVEGCFFHLCQNVYRRVQDGGLQERYATDAAFSLKIRMLTALAFVRQADLSDYYVLLEESFPECAEHVILYVEEYYIGRLRPNGTRRTPTFPPALWNMRNAVLQGQPRTNNAQEGWYRRFASAVNCHHPSIWKLITSLADEERSSSRRREQLVAGHDAPARKKRYVDRDRRLLRLVEGYDVEEPHSYFSEALPTTWRSTSSTELGEFSEKFA